VSTNREEFIMVGVNLTDKEVKGIVDGCEGRDEFERESHYYGLYDQHHHVVGDLCILTDGMNGEYAIMGVLLAKGTQHEGMDFQGRSIKSLQKECDRAKEWIRKIAGIRREPEVFFGTHWRGEIDYDYSQRTRK